MRFLELHIIKIRLLGAEAALELACVGGALTSSAPSRSRRGRTPNGTYLLLEAHAVATLLDGVFVKTFALLRERHELVRLRVTRRVTRRRSSRRRRVRTTGDHTRFAGRRARTVLPNMPSRRGILSQGYAYISCPGYRRQTLAVVSKINQWIGQTYDGALMAKLAP